MNYTIHIWREDDAFLGQVEETGTMSQGATQEEAFEKTVEALRLELRMSAKELYDQLLTLTSSVPQWQPKKRGEKRVSALLHA